MTVGDQPQLFPGLDPYGAVVLPPGQAPEAPPTTGQAPQTRKVPTKRNVAAAPAGDDEIAAPVRGDNDAAPPFETDALRGNLARFLQTPFTDPQTGDTRPVGNWRWGVYAFYDYDGEPIYVGQTNERLRVRIRRHLTNQRTDAVAMSVLDPFEVFEIEVWPLPCFETTDRRSAEARAALDALENAVYQQAINASRFNVVLNEKNPPTPVVIAPPATSLRGCIVSGEVARIRSHPDFRIARRALVISRLAQVISERKVQGGLRRVLTAQARRLQWLAERRYSALGGETSISETGDEAD